MAEGKKSFVLYSDQRSIIERLSNEQAGTLLKHIFSYVNDENPEDKDPMVMLAFEPIKLQLKRDLIKWEGIKGNRSKAGKASAEARRLEKESQQTSTHSTHVDFVQQTSTHSTVNVNDNVTVNVNDIIPPNPLKGELTEKEKKFLEWFNNNLEIYNGKKGKFRSMTRVDKDNLKKLRSSYDDGNEWLHAFKMMLKSDWVIQNNKATVDHFLRNDNFSKYVNTIDQSKVVLSKFKAPWD